MIRKVFWTVIGLALFTAAAFSQTATVSGNLALPNGPAGGTFNGTVQISLPRGTVTNICSSPVQVVPFATIVAKITAGAMASTTLYTTDCISPHLPYAIKVYDTNNKQIYTDNWYIPNTTTVNVGNLSSVDLAAAITVSVPLAIVQNPAGGQTVTQPGATFLSVNNLQVTGTFSFAGIGAGSISGNAATATALAANPSKCGAGFYATGINANGTAVCSNTFPGNPLSQAYLQVTSNTTFPTQGGYVTWNLSAGGGETDIVNQRGGGAGGISFYNATAGGTLGPVLVHIDGNGTITSAGGALGFNGNASTASALLSAPAQCPAGQFATGIQVSGAANCSGQAGLNIQHGSSHSVCTTGASSFSTCLTAVTWPVAFPNNSYNVTCTGISPSDARATIVGIPNRFTASVNVDVGTMGSVAVTYGEIDCQAME